MEHGKDPEDGGEGHRAEDDDLDLVLGVEVLDVFKEFGEQGECFNLTFGYKVGPDHGGKSEGINDDTRTFREDNTDPA